MNKDKIILIVSGFFFAASITAIIWQLQPEKYEYTLKCSSCEKKFVEKFPTKTKFPIPCKSCKTQEVYVYQPHHCGRCKATFDIVVEELPQEHRCKKCKFPLTPIVKKSGK